MRLLMLLVLIATSQFVTLASAAEKLPEGLTWLNGGELPEWSSEAASKGGIMRLHIASFPPTLRTVGPDSNNSFRSYILDNQLPLVDFHPNTKEIIPMLATHWAYDKDGKTVYYKIDPMARWSDGKPVTADDFLFALEFMRSKAIVAPWYNKHYTEEVVNITKFDDHTISITGARPKPPKDLHYFYTIAPRPKHFHKLDQDWVKKFNWRTEPNTGAYQISKVKKGKQVEFTRKQNWWARDKRYLRNRFNVDKVILKVVRDPNTAFKYFERGELDVFNITMPTLWHEKANSKTFNKGFIHKLSFYNQTEKSASGLFLNTNNEILADINVRKALGYATNYDRVIKHLLRNDFQRLPSFHTGYGDYSNPDINPLPFDLTAANKLLDDAGWDKKNSQGIRTKSGKTLTLQLSYGNKLVEQQLLVLAEEAKKAGFNIKPQYLESTSFYKNVIEKKHDIAYLGWSTGFRPAFWQHFHSDNADKPQTNNITNLKVSAIDKMINQYRESTAEPERIDLAHQLAHAIAEQHVFIPSTMTPLTRAGFWRWFQLPEIPGTKSSNSLFDPFNSSYGGLFWLDNRIKVDTLSARRSGGGFAAQTHTDTTYKSTP